MQQRLREEGWYVAWNLPCCQSCAWGELPYEFEDGTAKKEPQKYTGTLIKGIATMHKSNAVPVINEQQAKDISSMRR